MSEKKYVIDDKKLMSEWDWQKNNELGFNPKKLSCGSHKKVFWVCKKHNIQYSQVIRDKIRGQLSCKQCFNEREFEPRRKRYLGNRKVLAETHPHLVEEWVSCEDPKITPHNCVSGTNKKVTWKCKTCGGEYSTYIYNRAKNGTGCRYCSGQAVLKGFNDLCTTNPDLAKEWSEKNDTSPDTVLQFSKKKALWKCPLGHEDYSATIQQRSLGQGCPICAQQSQTSFPEQAIYFYVKKIFPDATNRFIFDKKYEIDIYIPSIQIGIEYNGYFSHKGKELKDKEKKEKAGNIGVSLLVIKEYKKEVEKIDADYYVHERTTPNDLNSLISEVINDIYGKVDFEINVAKDMIKIQEQYVTQKSEKSIAKLRPDLVNEWDFTNNGKMTPDLVTIGSSLKFFWICPICNKSYLCAPKDKVRGSSCPVHRNRIIIKGGNDFASKYPELLKYWDYENNKQQPDKVYFNSTKKINWICEKGHHYSTSIANRVKGKSCLVCINKQVLKGYNDLLSQKPELAQEWDYELNSIKPDEIYYKNQRELIHWVCKTCGYKWTSKISQRKDCPKCKENRFNINVYNLSDLSYYGTFKSSKELCNHFNIDINKQHGNIAQICNRKQKSLFGKYVLRHPYDDEFKK